MKTILYDKNNRPIGYVVDEGSRIRAYNAIGNYLGCYEKEQDRTYDAMSRPVGRGQLLAMLFTK